MAVVSIVASPRKNGAGDRIVGQIEAGARSAGRDVVRFNLNDMRSYRQCQNCEACKNNGGTCVIKDDISPIIDAVRDAEAVVLCTNISFNEMNGLFKLFHDRMYVFLDMNATTILPKGKKLATVVTAGLDDMSADRVSKSIEKVMAEHFFFEPVGRMTYLTWMMPRESPIDEDVLKEAFDIGTRL